MISIAVIAPAQAVRAGLRTLMAQESDMQVVAEAAALLDLEGELPELDVVLLAEEAVEMEDLEALLADSPAPFGALLIGAGAELVQALSDLPLRGWGLLPPEASAEELAAGVRAVHEGLLVSSPSLLEPWLDRRLVLNHEAEALVEPLTDREQEVLGLLAGGLANKQIAAELGISEHTVKFHVSSVYAKLGATNRAEAVRLGARQGLITL